MAVIRKPPTHKAINMSEAKEQIEAVSKAAIDWVKNESGAL